MAAVRSHRWVGFATGVIAALLLGAGGTWAAVSVLRPVEDPLEALPFTYVTVTEGSVGSEITLSTVAEWKPTPVGDNRASGVVTSVAIDAGSEVAQGSMLYSVNLRPVVVAKGDTPAFRPIGEDASGPDVAQLQQMLADLGFYYFSVDGEAGAGTVAAIRAWQESLGLEPTGQMETGDVIFLPSLPARITLDAEKVSRGATLVGGEPVVRALPLAPAFAIPVTEAQAVMMPPGTHVEVQSPNGGVWDARASEQVRDVDSQTVSVTLVGADAAPVCGAECDQVQVDGQARLSSRIVTIEQVSGLVVPSAALVTTASNETAVIDVGGERMIVTVVSSARGMSVVEGVEAGTKVRVPATNMDADG